jgi:hypothetical protein
LGISFEEAVQIPKQRIMHLIVNGTPMRTMEMWKLYGVDPKKGNARKSEKKMTFKETLNHFGVDTANIEITIA